MCSRTRNSLFIGGVMQIRGIAVFLFFLLMGASTTVLNHWTW